MVWAGTGVKEKIKQNWIVRAFWKWTGLATTEMWKPVGKPGRTVLDNKVWKIVAAHLNPDSEQSGPRGSSYKCDFYTVSLG